MATAVTDELKQELMSRGIWADFVRVREDIEAGGEYKTSRLRTMAALEKLAPDLVERVRPRGRPRGNPPSIPLLAKKPQEEVTPENAAGEPAPEMRGTPHSHPSSLADVRRDNREQKMKWQLHGVDKEPSAVRVRVSKSTFAGKTCTISAAFMWAYSNLCFEDASPEDAPSAVAWQMYCDMMTSPSLKADMLKSGLGAAMRKAEAEDETNGRFDGEGEYDLVSKIAREGGE